MSVASGSTATATTVTADTRTGYRGRFAPSPSGALHLGSLAAALGSWLDARAHGGTWLIRIEDLDAARVAPGAADTMVRTLAGLGLESDEPILVQSTRRDAHEAAFRQLAEEQLTYPCACTRRHTAAGPYAGTCRNGPQGQPPWAWRLRLPATGQCGFEDAFQGLCQFHFQQLGDPVLRRRDGLIAYQLAVVVDDGFQGITDIVRGADLLDATAWQLQIRRHLSLPEVRHGHLPLVEGPDGRKLSKSESAASIATLAPGEALVEALRALRQSPPEGLSREPPGVVLSWATTHWNPSVLRLTEKPEVQFDPF